MNLFYSNLRRLVIIALMLCTGQAFSQLAVNSGATATELVNQILGPGVTVSNVNIDCGNNGSAIFTNGQSTNIGLDQGILLTSGLASDAIGPNISGSTSHNSGNGSDPDLATLIANPLFDACALTFDFVANANTITVQYVFASEEYNEYVCSSFNDVFGFFVSGPNPIGGNYVSENVALVPSTTLPVTINSINNGSVGANGSAAQCISLANAGHFVDNTGGITIEYDGFTTVLTATLNIVPGETYTFKFAIADATDASLDSGVFIKGNSFSTFFCQAGTISIGSNSAPSVFCSYDQNKIVSAQTNSTLAGEFYEYILSNASGEILAINSFGSFDLDGYAPGIYLITGISYSGEIAGLEVGNNISDIEAVENEGCVELSNSLSFEMETCLDVICPEDANISCEESTLPENTGSPEIIGDPSGLFTAVYTDEVSAGCTTIITRTWTIVSVTGAPAPVELICVQTITSVDNTAPTFNEEIFDIHVQCPEDVPAFPDYTATDNCSDIILEGSYESSNLLGDETCILTTAYGLGVDWSIWLANLPGASDYYHFTPDGGTMQVYNDGSALITGTVVSSNNANHIFNVFIRLENKRNWAEWSALGRDYKDDALLAGDNYLDWMYYELDGNNSFLVGAGDLAGSILNLTHMPENFMFGFQCGLAANNKNANFGMSGWFFYNGWFNGATVSGVGDVNVDKECEPNNQVNECEYIIQRFWFALDACGNLGTAQQTITVADTEAPVFTVVPEDLFLDCIADVPAADVSQLEAEDNCDDAVTITYEGDFQTGGDCNAIIVRTYEAIDSCGNFVKHFQTITVVDDEAPVLVGVPADAAYSCEDEIPAPADVTATDNCTDDVVVSFNETIIPGDCPQSYVIERTWSATDNCDNTVSATQYITVSDELAPVITECPADASYDCLADVPAADVSLVSATDNCGNVTIVLHSEITDGDECEGTIVRTYRATDECGNFSDCVQVINYNDNVAPTFDNAPANIAVSCDNIPEIEDVTASDNCGAATVTVVETMFSGGCVGVIQRIFTATDACGNTATHEQYITLVDTVAPVLHNLPADATYECSDKLPFIANVTATDNCDSSVIVEFSETTQEGTCPQEYTIFRTWSATDTCENTVSYTQIINIVDTTAPTFNVQDSEITVACDFVVDVATPVATDNCDSTPTVTVASSSTPGDCPNEWTEVYTWTATDDCGNSSSVSLTINYVDEVAPVFTMVPQAISVECGQAIPVTSAMATDNCGDVTITYADSDLLTDNCAGFYVRTFTAVDECGNSATATQIIDIIDTTAPVITACPADASYDCLADVPAANTALVSATDVCSDVTIVLHSEVTDGDECEGVIVRTYRATDVCGNFSDCVQVITYNDNVAPTFDNAPANMVASCDNIPAIEDVTASDNCGAATVTVVETMFSGGCVGVIQRIFTATDACGNTATHEQYITLVDTIAPVLANLPADAAYECDEVIPAPANVTATDNCDASVIVEFSETTEAGDCPQEYTIFRTWTATDTCENSVSYTQVITVSDNTAPTFNVQDSEITVACDFVVDVATPVATDNCDSTPTVTVASSSTPGDCPNEWTEVYTWTATDDCGNSSSVSLTINYVDEVAPVFTMVPQAISVECGQAIPVTSAMATDNCGDVTITYDDSDLLTDNCAGFYVRTFTAVDECGNSATATQIIDIIDTTAPVITACPADASYDCLADVPAANTALVSATDVCSDVTIVLHSEVTDGDECEGVIVRTYRATDVCGNFSDCVQVITYNDNVAPTFDNAPANMVASCDNIPAIEDVTASDNCGAATVTVVETMFSGGCVGVIQRIFTATDACGNTATHEQYITLVDTIAPVLANLPADAAYECDEVIPAPANVTATDNCDASVIVEFSETTEAGDCPQEYTIFRTWSATDTCENSVSYTQVITITDTTAPTFNVQDSEITVDCDFVVDVVTPVATDNCDSTPTVTVASSSTPGDCPNEWTEVYTWTATDDCGNSSSVSLTINYVDEVAPVFTMVPQAISVECGQAIPVTSAMATDNCGDVTITYADSDLLTDNCAGFYVRTFTAVDECGNSATATQIIDIIDTTAPVITACPADASYDCLADVPAANTALVSATDVCSDVTIVLHSEVTDGDECEGVIVRTYRAYDACENFSECVQVITYNDDVAPTFDNAPANMVASCDNIPAIEDVTASDNCGEATVTVVETMFSGGCVGVIQRIFTATDACGNSVIHEQYITLVDTIAPVLANLPADATYECDQDIPAPANVTATDNCDASVIVEFSETTEAGDCPQEYTIFRTWSATDTCENSVSHTQVITITDNTAPTFDIETSEITVSCDTPILIGNPVATDNCDSAPVVTLDSSTTPGDCPNEWTEVHTWTAVDACGNSSSVSLTVNYVDEIAPVFTSVPQDLFFDCIDDVPAADTSALSATDNCGDVTISHLGDTQNGDDCDAVITRTYRATDECGNFVDHVQTIVVLDDIAPVWDAIAEDFTTTCEDVPPPVDCYATDNCSGIAAGFSEVIEEGCPTIITRTWTATDDCGNMAVQTQIITVIDTVAPVITACPSDASYDCLADVPAADVSLVSAEDVCNEVTIVLHSEVTDGDECEGVIIRTYRAYDACENYSECVQVITYNDDVAPTFDNAPANMVASCENIPAIEEVTASDNCGDATVTVVETNFSGGCVGVIQRIFTATDACGNTATHEQYITLIDTVAPVLFNLPADMDVECSDKMPFVANVTATDNCDNGVNIEFTETIIDGDCANNYTIVRTWTATDTCENSVSHTQYINVSDNTAPVLSGEDDELTIDCNAAIQLIAPTATDNCDDDVNVELDVQTIPGNCPNEWTEVYTWTAMDNCGNSAVRVITLNYVDDNGPVFTDVADDMFFECIADVPAPNTQLFSAEDNCGDVIITHVGDEQIGDDCDAVIYRTYRAMDACNNYNDYTQVIVVADSIAPWFNEEVASVIDAECSEVPAAAVLTASDNCSDALVVLSEIEEAGDCDGEYTIIRTWTATDACGNSTSVTQVVNVYDNTPPVFVDAPADAFYTCDDEIPALEDCIAIDNCSGNITYTSVEYIEGYTGEDGLRECTLTTPFNVIGQPWALWLPNSIGEPQYYYLSEAGGQFTELPNGRAHLTGVAYAHNNPNKRWIIDVYFKDRADWTTWSALGRSYKDDAMVAGNLFETWDYYVMNADSAVLTGDGLYAGANLNLSHMPASLYFGFQVGQAANNRNAADGMSGWFFYNGNWNNADVNGVGDFGFESDCPECDYTITRIWTATDDCGNESVAVQVITVQEGDSNLEGGIAEQQIGRDSGVTLAAWPNPTAHKSTINFSVPFGGNVILEVFNMDGKLMQTLYQGEVMANQDHFYQLNAEKLSNGIYVYKLTTEKGSYVEKLMIVK
jgi:large repetitive protein